MTLAEVMSTLAALGSEQSKKTLLHHGAVEPFFGVKIGDLKPLARKLKGEQTLALELYATGNSDSQYLAGMIADGAKMTRTELNAWARTTAWGLISGNTVAWVASEHLHGLTLAIRWIEGKKESVIRSGWATLCALATVILDERMPLDKFAELLGTRDHRHALRIRRRALPDEQLRHLCGHLRRPYRRDRPHHRPYPRPSRNRPGPNRLQSPRRRTLHPEISARSPRRSQTTNLPLLNHGIAVQFQPRTGTNDSTNAASSSLNSST
ncbi:MAG: DNA alkylation repair protein [Candidatus Synoicihabitans palmerolidicus]|nr:DNA alkylation repair protein [Candidatus Synoicihabitans palmerolidicus]